MNIIDMAASVGIDPKTIRAMVYKDECNDLFFLTKNAEIFPLNDTTVRVYYWPRTSERLSRFKGLISKFHDIDEEYYTFDVDRSNLAAVLHHCGTVKQRSPRGSKRLRTLEKVLGHQIIKWTPEITKAY